MKEIRLTIGQKVLLLNATLVLIFLISAIFSLVRLRHSSQRLEAATEIVSPSIEALSEFVLLVTRSKMYVSSWVNDPSNYRDREALRELHTLGFPTLRDRIGSLKTQWSNQEQSAMADSVILQYEALLKLQRNEIMQVLVEFEDYNDKGGKPFSAKASLKDKVVPISNQVIERLQRLLQVKQEEKRAIQREVSYSISALQWTIGGFLAMLLAFAVLASYVSDMAITKPIQQVNDALLQLSEGKMPSERLAQEGRLGRDEITDMALETNRLIEGYKETARFAQEIGTGNYKAQFEPLSTRDELGNALLEMRDNLRRLGEESEKRNWSTTGIALFSDVLRTRQDDLEQFYYNFVVNLVRYLDANQGGLFIYHREGQEEAGPPIPQNIGQDSEEEEPSALVSFSPEEEGEKKEEAHVEEYMTLAACYAWDKQRFLEKKVYKGEGLAGQCWLENGPIYVTDVPHDYIEITSGLGHNTPRSVLLAPLTFNDEFFGVIELASFHAFERHHVEFVQKVCDNCASTLSIININDRTRRLLEASQRMTEQMRAQEEEMRQNMEELQTTQEEMARSQREMSEREKVFNEMNLLIELDTFFTIQRMSHHALDYIGYAGEEMVGQSVIRLFNYEEDYKLFKENLQRTNYYAKVVRFVGKRRKQLLVKLNAATLYDEKGHGRGYIMIVDDVSEVEELFDMEQQNGAN